MPIPTVSAYSDAHVPGAPQKQPLDNTRVAPTVNSPAPPKTAGHQAARANKTAGGEYIKLTPEHPEPTRGCCGCLFPRQRSVDHRKGILNEQLMKGENQGLGANNGRRQLNKL